MQSSIHVVVCLYRACIYACVWSLFLSFSLCKCVCMVWCVRTGLFKYGCSNFETHNKTFSRYKWTHVYRKEKKRKNVMFHIHSSFGGIRFLQFAIDWCAPMQTQFLVLNTQNYCPIVYPFAFLLIGKCFFCSVLLNIAQYCTLEKWKLFGVHSWILTLKSLVLIHSLTLFLSGWRSSFLFFSFGSKFQFN